MAVNGNICQTAFADLGKLPKKLSITQLQVALANLNALKGNVPLGESAFMRTVSGSRRETE